MSKFVTFGMYWQCYGQQCIELPDNIDETDMDTVSEYIQDQWDDIPLPSGDYVMGSDELDEESICIKKGTVKFTNGSQMQVSDRKCELVRPSDWKERTLIEVQK